MANSVDKRIVEMQFDNARFEANMNQSIGTLDKLKQALNLDDAAKGFNKLEKQANSIDLSGLERSISNIERRFSALGIAGATIVSNLTNKAIGAVGKLNNAIFGQMKSGGISRALNLEHANFMLEGLLKDSEKVAEIMKEGGPVQNAVKGTAYGLDAAANAAAQFVASGVKDTDKLETALTAISGAAAMTGSSYEDISRIFTTVAGNGRLMADQLNQFSARGINAAATLAEHLGKTEAEIREMTSKGKIDFETFADVMNKAFGEQAKKANETFTGALSNVKAALSRIGAKVATPTLEKLRELFVSLIDVVNMASKVLDPFIGLINNVIGSVLGGITDTAKQLDKLQSIFENVVNTIGEAVQTVYSIILPIKRAFQEVFPPKTIDDAETLTKAIKKFVKTLQLSASQMTVVTRIFRGVFSVFDIIGQVVSALVRVLFPATNGLKGFIGSFANGAATLGDYIYAISKVLKESDAIYTFFIHLKNKISDASKVIKQNLGDILGKVKEFISKFNIKLPNGTDFIGKLASAFKKNQDPLNKAGNMFITIFSGIGKVIKEISPLLGSFGEMVGRALGEISNAFETVFSGGGFKTLLSLVNAAILSKIAIDVAGFISSIGKNVEAGTKIFKNINGVLSSAKGLFKTLELSVKGDIVKKFAVAIGILVGSLVLLSLIQPEALTRSMVAITVLMAELMGMLYLFTKMSDSLKDNMALITGAFSFAAIGAGVLLLAGALKSIASIDSDKLGDALGVVIILLLQLTSVALVLGNFGQKIGTGAVALIAFAASVKILGSAIAQLGALDPETLTKGIVGVTVAIVELAAAAAIIGSSNFGASQGAGILLMAAALKVMAGAIGEIGNLQPEVLTKGLVAIAAALAEVAVFMTVMGDGKHLIGTAVAFGILALGLMAVANAVQTFGSMSLGDLAKGIGGVAVVLIAMGTALYALSTNALGVIGAAAGIAILAVSLNALIPILLVFSSMDLPQLGITLLGLAGSLAILGAAAAIFGLAAGPMLIGAGVIAALGAACLVSAAGMAASAIAIGLLVSAFEELTTLSWGDLLSGIGKLAVTFAALAAASLLLTPTVAVAVAFSVALIGIGTAAMLMAASLTVAAIGTALMAAALKKFDEVSWESIGKGLLVLVSSLVVLGGCAALLAPLSPVILAIGVGIAAMGVGALATAAALLLFGQAIEVLAPYVTALGTAIAEFAANAWEYIKSAVEQIWNALVDFGAKIGTFVIDIGAKVLKALADLGANILKVLTKLGGEMLKALGVPEDWVNIANDFIGGLIEGITDGIKKVIDKCAEVGKAMIEGVRNKIRSHSNSEEGIDIGHDWDGGIIEGVMDLKDQVVAAVADVGAGMIDQAQADANAVKSIWAGLSVAQKEGAAAEDRKRMAMMGYNNIQDLTKAGQAGLLNEEMARRKALREQNAVKQETAALGKNTGGTKSNTKAKKENEKANEKKTESIDEESEALNEETEAAEDNREEIMALAEEIEVITKEFDKSFNYLQSRDNFKIVKNLTKAFSTFWSKGLGEDGWKKASQINKAFKQVNKTIKATTNTVKKGAYSFDETGKYAGKLAKKLSKSTKKIEEQVMKSGKTVIKVTEGQATAFSKVGNAVQKTTMRLSKNVKNLGKYFNELREFQSEMERVNAYEFLMNTDNAYDYITKLRKIEKYYVKLGQMPQKIQDFMLRINEKLSPFNDALNTLGKRLDGVNSYMNQKSSATAYVQDAFISLAATLYDGSEAANEYETEHARLLFLLEHGEATIEDVEEHFRSYISRIMEALEEYRNSIEENLRGSFDIWSEFDKKIEDSNKNFLDTIESQIAGYNQWADMLFELSKRGVDMNILKMLTDEGVSSYGKLKSLLGMTANQIALFNQRYAESENAIKKARDTSLAALANATTRATQRAAAESSKNAKTQLKQSKAVAKRLIDDAKAVAENQARYRSLSAREEELYLQKITGAEKEAYQARLREVKKAMKAEQKAAKKEETKRAREKKVATILSEVKSFEKLRKQYHKYIGDAKMLKEINKQIEKSLEKVNKKIKAFDGKSVKEMRYSWLAFAETLEATGNETNDYLTEMSERLEKFVEEVETATKAGEDMFKTFEKADKQTFSQMYAGIKSQILARGNIGDLFNKVIKMGFSQEAISYLNDLKTNLPEFYATLESWSNLTSGQVALVNSSIKDLTNTTNNLNSLIENGFANTSTAAAQIAVENAQKTLDSKLDTLNKVKKETKSEIKKAEALKKDAENHLVANGAQLKGLEALLKVEGLTKKEKNSIKKEILTVQQENAKYLSQITEAEKKIDTANQNLEKATLEYDKAKSNLESKKQTLNAENSILAKKQILDSANSKLKEAQKAVEDAKSEANKQNKSLEAQITQWQTEMNNWSAVLANKKSTKKEKEKAQTNLINLEQKVAAAQTQMQKNTESVTKAQLNYEKALHAVEEAQIEYNKAVADNDARAAAERQIQDILLEINTYEKLTSALKKYGSNSELIKRINAGIVESVSGISGAIDQFGNHWKNITVLSAKTNLPAFSEISNAFLKFADTLVEANEEFSTFDNYIAARKQALSDYRDTLYDTIKGQVNLFEEFKRYSGEEATSADTYLANMQTQIKGLEDWLTNLEKLAKRGVSGDIIAMFASEGQNSFEKVEAFANATQEELIEFVGQYNKYVNLLDEAANRAMATVGSTYTDAALAATQSLLDQFNGAIDRSKVEEEAYETGVMIINGVKDGIGHVMPELMADVADSAEEAAAKKAGAAIGKAINDGIVKAISDNVASTVNAAIEKFKMAVDAVNSYVQENIPSEYTITIHVNTSEIDAAVARMNTAIYGINANAGVTQQAVVTSQENQQSYTPTALGAEGTVNNVTLNYTQNNTSPVALSRTEIYRQTQNQLSTINGAISAAMG